MNRLDPLEHLTAAFLWALSIYILVPWLIAGDAPAVVHQIWRENLSTLGGLTFGFCMLFFMWR